MFGRLLDHQDQVTRETERAQLDKLREALIAFAAPEADVAVLRQAIVDLDEMFLLVVVGEFNSGKSSFINALIGADVMPEGVTPTTNLVNTLRWGDVAAETVEGEALIARYYPAEFLREISVVDTPGTNAILERHEAITRAFVPRSDLVLFITSAERPFTASERDFLTLIRDWGKKVVMVINKIDILANPDEAQQVVGFVRDNARATLGVTPEVLPVSARVARKAKQTDNQLERDALLRASGFDQLEAYIAATLDEKGRVRLKLQSPLNVGLRLADKYIGLVDTQLARLGEDVKTSDQIDEHLELFAQDMRHDFHGRLGRINGIIWNLEKRGDQFFEDRFRLTKVFDLLNAEQTRGDFEREVIADTVTEVDTEVQALIDWLIERELRTWRSTTEFLARRRQAAPNEQLIGEIGRFEYNRAELLGAVARRAREVIDTFDRNAEATKLGGAMRDAVAQTALAQVGALSLGAGIVLLIGTIAADVTGVLAAATIAGLGLYIIPFRRRQARQNFQARTEDLRQRLTKALTEQFERELTAAVGRIRDAVTPFTRFVRAEQRKMQTSRGAFATVDAELRRIRQALELA